MFKHILKRTSGTSNGARDKQAGNKATLVLPEELEPNFVVKAKRLEEADYNLRHFFG